MDKRALRQLVVDWKKTAESETDSSSGSESFHTATPQHVTKHITPPYPPTAHIPVAKVSDKTASHGTSLYRPTSFVLPTGASLELAIKDVESVDHASSSSSIETKTEPFWSGYEKDVLPDKSQGRIARNLRHQVFSLYRRLFGVVFVANLAIFVAILFRGASTPHLGQIVLANLCCAILMRQDYVINAFFTFFCAVPTSCALFLLSSGDLLTVPIQLAVGDSQSLRQSVSHRWFTFRMCHLRCGLARVIYRSGYERVDQG